MSYQMFAINLPIRNQATNHVDINGESLPSLKNSQTILTYSDNHKFTCQTIKQRPLVQSKPSIQHPLTSLRWSPVSINSLLQKNCI